MFGIDYQTIRFWIDMMTLLWALMVSGFVFWDRRNKVTQDAIKSLRVEVAKEIADVKMNLDARRAIVDETLQTLRVRLSETTTRADLAPVYSAISEVSEVATELRGTVAAISQTLHMINQHLLDK
ncbi:MAG TPA: hypothetical protein PK440_07735 [Candidatus Accumulibacter phosphatis]|nr:MAG: hypothetical protein AW07_03105 [Candidatus Accumulibacter sp. SK-11]HAY29318.1 hypothetical protein [Accumulibacter sp.]HCN68585.1 hypothetical protein [Accumulibacter sp.]HRL76279.1 hypothetical protein [Candidatus Accumulibacter phosphatis]HRQ94875.1 hypothetical protein [Candidatus Accumulibacter phosphatis]